MAITITHDNTILLNSIHVNVDDNQYYKYVSSEILYFKKDSNYELTYRAISNVSYCSVFMFFALYDICIINLVSFTTSLIKPS